MEVQNLPIVTKIEDDAIGSLANDDDNDGAKLDFMNDTNNHNNINNNNNQKDTIDIPCWKCKGSGQGKKPKRQRKHQNDDNNNNKNNNNNNNICSVCQGTGHRKASQKSQLLAEQNGVIVPLRGYPPGYYNDCHDTTNHHPYLQGTFAGPPAKATKHLKNKNDININNNNDDENNTIVKKGEILASLGCGDWRIFQLVNGHKLTVDDFICAWVAANEIKKKKLQQQQPQQQQHQRNVSRKDSFKFGNTTISKQLKGSQGCTATSSVNTLTTPIFRHLDMGCGCGSVLMTMAWAFPGKDIMESTGIEAQEISFNLCQRGLLWNVGHYDGGCTSRQESFKKINHCNNNQQRNPKQQTETENDDDDDDDDNEIEYSVRVFHADLRTWEGEPINDDNNKSTENENSSEDSMKKENQTKLITTNSTAATTTTTKPTTTTNTKKYHVITGTPPYFPTDQFVASENHSQKVRCRVPTRGAASDYMIAASKHLEPNDGIFVMVETAAKRAEQAILHTLQTSPNLIQNHWRVVKRIDVITREGLPPRFSCWVFDQSLLLQQQQEQEQQSMTIESNIDNNMNNNQNVNNNSNNNDNDMKNTLLKFPIETFTLRDKELNRTMEYIEAMESMGWIDFENTREKLRQKQQQK